MNTNTQLASEKSACLTLSFQVLAAYSSRIKLVGISTVSGNQTIEKTTLNTLNVLNLIGLLNDSSDKPPLDFPLIQGAAKPLMRPGVICDEIHGESGLETHLLWGKRSLPKWDRRARNCPVFALDNALASGKSLPRWSPRARLGLNLGPSPIHARNVYLVLNLITGCVSPQYHCRFDDFFETTRHGGPDVSGTICWQQLAGLSRADHVPMEFEQHPSSSTVQNETPPDTLFPSDEFSISTIDHEATMDDETSTAGESLPSRAPRRSQASTQAEGALQITPTITAGTSRAGRIRVMSQRMAESTSQRDFFGNAGMHYMANQSTVSRDETPEDLFHDQHLALQDRMRNPIAFHAEMMGDIMYYHQALQQPDAKQFADAVVKEVNGHVDCNNWNLIVSVQAPKNVGAWPEHPSTAK